MRDRPGTVLIAVVALCALAVAVVLSLLFAGDRYSDETSPFIFMVLGFISTTLVSLMALFRIEDTQRDLRDGAVKKPVMEALHETLTDGDELDNKIRALLMEVLVEQTDAGLWDGVTDRRKGGTTNGGPGI